MVIYVGFIAAEPCHPTQGVASELKLELFNDNFSNHHLFQWADSLKKKNHCFFVILASFQGIDFFSSLLTCDLGW